MPPVTRPHRRRTHGRAARTRSSPDSSPTRRAGRSSASRFTAAPSRATSKATLPDRPVIVYLPPSYAKETSRRYPVLYYLHGYTATAEAYAKVLALPTSVDRAVAAGVREMIVVFPDAFTKYSGSMYLQFADDRRLGDVHRAGSAGVHRQAIPHHRVERQPRTGRALDGRIRHDASGNEAARVVCRALRNELVLPDERPGCRPRLPERAVMQHPAAATERAAAPPAAETDSRTRWRRKRRRGHPIRTILRSTSICRRRKERSSRSSPRNGRPTRRW